MAVDWINGFIIPIIKTIFIGGLVGWITYIVCKAFWNAWSKSAKFFLKYKIMKKPYPEQTVKWILDCIDEGIGYYDAKKILFIKMMDQKTINETMWIFDQIIIEMKGGKNINGREFKADDSKTQRTETKFPNIR